MNVAEAKLILQTGRPGDEAAADPRFAVTLPPENYEDSYQTALKRFLDQYLTAI